jgi:hypothetical protein
MSQPTVQFFMTLRNSIKLYHWNTKSYSRHKATDQFIENFDKLTDRFVEVYIGHHGRHLSDSTIDLQIYNEKSIIALIEKAREWLTVHLPKQIGEKDTDLLNIRDEMLAEINQMLYLFTLA